MQQIAISLASVRVPVMYGTVSKRMQINHLEQVESQCAYAAYDQCSSPRQLLADLSRMLKKRTVGYLAVISVVK
jgi:hypothetical protein